MSTDNKGSKYIYRTIGIIYIIIGLLFISNIIINDKYNILKVCKDKKNGKTKVEFDDIKSKPAYPPHVITGYSLYIILGLVYLFSPELTHLINKSVSESESESGNFSESESFA